MKTVFLAFTLKQSSVAEFFVELANQLSTKHKVIIITHSVEKHDLKLDKKVEVLKWPSKRPTKLADFFFLTNLIKRRKPEIMISNFSAVNIFLIAGYLFRVPHRVAWYHTLSTQLKKKSLLQFRKKMIYKMASEIIANSKASKKDLIENFGVKQSRVSVVNNALRVENIYRKEDPEKIVYAGRLDAIKGVPVLIKALPAVLQNFPKIKLHIIGDDKTGDDVGNIKCLVDELGLNKSVIFQGNRNRIKVLEEFSSACFTIVPSKFEAFGYVVIESFAVGTPVIGSNTTGIAEVIRDKVDGFLFEVGNSTELSERMILLLSDAKLRSKMGQNCKSRYKEKYELSKTVAKLQSKFS